MQIRLTDFIIKACACRTLQILQRNFRIPRNIVKSTVQSEEKYVLIKSVEKKE
jgi:hypothetical protein